MNTDLVGLLHAVAGLRVLVVGDAILDRYTTGRSGRMCREAPVPAVEVASDVDNAGGAANTATNLRALGATPALISVIGADAEADRLDAVLRERDVDTSVVLRDHTRSTPVRHRVLADGQMLLRLDRGSTSAAEHRELAHRIDSTMSTVDAVVVTDHGLGVLTPALVAHLAARRDSGPATVVVDSRHPTAFRDLRPTAIKPNYAEALDLAGIPPTRHDDRARQLHDRGDELLARTGADLVAVTLDVEGALLVQHGRPPMRTHARGGGAVSSVGAGDTFTAALALALAAGADPGAAAEFASAAAGAAVTGPGTTVCDADVLRRRLTGTTKIGTRDRLSGLRDRARRIVFTNGCFDILHGGHVSLLSRAKELGDLLVVGVNSDASVRRLKGDSRPVNPLADRMRVLAALSCVDLVVPFDADSPTDLIEAIRPDVYVKGADYTRHTLPEVGLVERLGGVVHLLGLVDDTSTTGLLRRIRALAGTGPTTAPGGNL